MKHIEGSEVSWIYFSILCPVPVQKLSRNDVQYPSKSGLIHLEGPNVHVRWGGKKSKHSNYFHRFMLMPPMAG